jgi:GNAT superfamily N-acetyltransferase
MAFIVRPFNSEDIGFALAQTRREGWDNTAELFELALEHDPNGCYVVEVGGEPAGMITSTCFAKSAWLGNLIVAPDARQRGIGQRLMAHAIGTLTGLGIGTFRLEADPMGVGLYRRLGFVDQFETTRFKKTPPHNVDPVRSALHVTADDIDDIDAYDRTGFGDNRGRLLDHIIRIAPAAFCLRRRDGTLAGYAATLPSTEGVRLGPCVANDADTAARLLDAVLSVCGGVPIVTAVPDVNPAAIEVMKSRGFQVVGSCIRMCLGPPVAESDPHKLVAITYGAIG